MKGKKQRIWKWWYYFIKWSKMGFYASRMLFFQILYVPWIWTTKIWCSYAYFLHLIIIFNNLKSVCVTSENWNMDLKSQKLGFLARDKLRLSKKEIWWMFEHFLYLILPIFVGQTPKYSVVCFETDCATCFCRNGLLKQGQRKTERHILCDMVSNAKVPS